jgi:hypothetical protein
MIRCLTKIALYRGREHSQMPISSTAPLAGVHPDPEIFGIELNMFRLKMEAGGSQQRCAG